MSLPEITVVAAIIYNHNKRILITKRPDHLHLGGLWEFPGGKVEDGESHKDALKREIFEETALEIETGELFWQETVDYSKKRVHLFFYNCSLQGTNQQIHMHEIDDYRWIEKTALSDYCFPEGDTRLINMLQKY